MTSYKTQIRVNGLVDAALRACEWNAYLLENTAGNTQIRIVEGTTDMRLSVLVEVLELEKISLRP